MSWTGKATGASVSKLVKYCARTSALPTHLRPDLDLPRARGRVHRCSKQPLPQQLVEDHDRAALDELARATDEHGDELDLRRPEHVEHRPAGADHHCCEVGITVGQDDATCRAAT